MKNVMITVISSIQQKGEADINLMEFATEAEMTYGDEICHLNYEETEVSGLEGTKTSLKVEKNRIELTRLGTTNMELVFERDQRTTSCYHTPYGDFDLYVRTRSMEVDLDGEGFGAISLVYDMLIHGLSESRNTLEIQIKENVVNATERTLN